jgi:hypothetical protein
MTNEKALILSNVLTTIETEYFKLDSKFEIPKKLFYTVSKNISKLKKVVTEKSELDELVMKDFKKDFGFEDEKAKDDDYVKVANDKFKEYRESEVVKEQYLEFFQAEFKGDLRKVSADVLEEAILPSSYLEVLEDTILE